MSVESEILRIQHNVANAYAAVAERGGEVPLQPTSANLSAAVASIPAGAAITPGDGLSKDGDTLNVDNPVRGIMTQAEFDTLTEEQKDSGTYFVDDGQGGGGGGSGERMKIYSDGKMVEVSGGATMDQVNEAIDEKLEGVTAQEVYSTEEQRIGTWIDGKPLYRRVYKLTTPGQTSGGETIGTIEANINVVSIDGYMTTSVGVHQPINSIYGGNTVGTVTRDTNIKMYVNHTDYVSRPCWAILEYTKATDTAATTRSAQSAATIKLSNGALDLTNIPSAPVTAAAAGVEIARMEEV